MPNFHRLSFWYVGGDNISLPDRSGSPMRRAGSGANALREIAVFAGDHAMGDHGASAEGRRFEALPKVPTVAEALPGYEARTWAGVGAPKGTPAAVIARLDREIGAVLAEPTIEARLADLCTVPMPLNAQEFAAFIAAESEKWGKVVRIGNIAPQ